MAFKIRQLILNCVYIELECSDNISDIAIYLGIQEKKEPVFPRIVDRKYPGERRRETGEC